MAKKGSRFRKHSLEFKLDIVKKHLQDRISVVVLAQEHQLEPRLIRIWRILFVNLGEDGLKAKPKRRPKGTPAIGRPKTRFASELERLQENEYKYDFIICLLIA